MSDQEFTNKCDKCGCEFETYWDSQNHVCSEPVQEPEPAQPQDVQEDPIAEETPEIKVTEKKSSRKRRKSYKRRSRKTKEEEVSVTEFVPEKVDPQADISFPDFADPEEPQPLPKNRKRITENWQKKVLQEKPKKIHKYLQ